MSKINDLTVSNLYAYNIGIDYAKPFSPSYRYIQVDTDITLYYKQPYFFTIETSLRDSILTLSINKEIFNSFALPFLIVAPNSLYVDKPTTVTCALHNLGERPIYIAQYSIIVWYL